MTHSCPCLLAALALVAGCRNKDPGTAAPGSGGASGGTQPGAAGKTWVAVMGSGTTGAGFLGLASGGGHTYAVITREREAPVSVNGTEALPAAKASQPALVVLDAGGKLVGATDLAPGTQQYPDVFADGRGGLFAVQDTDAWVDGKTQGSIGVYPGKATPAEQLPITGFVTAIARTASGSIWATDLSWGNKKAAPKGSCDDAGFIAHRNASGGFDAVACDHLWQSMHVAAAGEDAVVCGSSVNDLVDLLGAEIPARTFVARIGADNKLKWIKAANELGTSSCEGIVVTSDGDIVVLGAGADGFDLTEDATKKGIKAKQTDDESVGETLYLERFSPDGERRWGHTFGSITTGFHASLTADDAGNAIFAASIGGRLDLGGGPVGPESASMAAAVDRDARVKGMVLVDGGASQLRAVTDGAGGLVLGFSSDDPVTVQGLAVPMQKGSTAVVRVPLPLPPPPAK